MGHTVARNEYGDGDQVVLFRDAKKYGQLQFKRNWSLEGAEKLGAERISDSAYCFQVTGIAPGAQEQASVVISLGDAEMEVLFRAWLRAREEYAEVEDGRQ